MLDRHVVLGDFDDDARVRGREEEPPNEDGSAVPCPAPRGRGGISVTTSAAGAASIIVSEIASQNTVRFNGVSATVASATTTSIVATGPAGATTGPISVTTPNRSATSSASFVVAAGNAPTITGFTPSIGTPGTAVTIKLSPTTIQTSIPVPAGLVLNLTLLLTVTTP